MTHRTVREISIRFYRHLLAASVLLALPALAEAGPPLICHPFDAGKAAVLSWGAGPDWNNPDRRYDVRQLTADTLRLLTPETPVIARMENLRRATIYASQNAQVADELLRAVIARAADGRNAQALFDAGYLIESYKQAAHLHRRPAPTTDGYAMVVRAITLAGTQPEMEFAASLMKSGAVADAHRQRARAGAAPGSLLAKNLNQTTW
jgi:hypothetical protein